MKILAIDSSSVVATVAITDEEKIIAEYSVNHKKTHSQTLLPMIDEIVKMAEINIDELDAIAVSGGPGSFTGLRIGSATAKGIAFAIKKPIIHIPTIDGLAYNMCGTNRIVCPIMDARRNQVYTGLYRFENDEFITIEAQSQKDIMDVIKSVNEIGKSVVFLGDGTSIYKEIITKNINVDCQFAPIHMNMQRASSVATLAVKYYNEGKVIESSEHKPDYLRKSQAERELEEKMKVSQ